MEYSAGIIPFRKNKNGQHEFFVGHPGGVGWQWKDYWAYLKGGVEGNETWEECALREFREESGLKLEGIKQKDLIPLGTSKQNKHKIVIALLIELFFHHLYYCIYMNNYHLLRTHQL